MNQRQKARDAERRLEGTFAEVALLKALARKRGGQTAVEALLEGCTREAPQGPLRRVEIGTADGRVLRGPVANALRRMLAEECVRFDLKKGWQITPAGRRLLKELEGGR